MLLTAGELAGIAAGVRVVEPDAFEDLDRAGPGARLIPAEQPRHGRDIVDHGAVREEAGVLDDIANATAEVRLVQARGVAAIEGDRAARRDDHAVDHAERRRLAAA